MQIAAEFVTSAAGAGDFPRERLPEVALVGRSNVGKSSLMNALVRQTLARTSAAPGKTRLANFYRVQRGAAPALYLVDLPGYGYARGGDASAREFNRLAEAYFDRPGHRGRAPARGLAAPGARVGPGGVGMAAVAAVSARVIGTKVDKLTRAERARHARQFESLFDIPVPLVSAHTGEGLDELWKMIASLPSQRRRSNRHPSRLR